MFRFFEGLTQPFPASPVDQPPKGLLPFCLYYAKGMKGPLIAMAVASASIAALEVSLFAWLGQLVDWFASRDPEHFIQQEKWTLVGLGLLVLLVLPALVLFQSLLSLQSLMGNFPMKVRWQAHQYLLNQSLGFFQDEFAGRVATKVMQTALAVREAVMKSLDVLVYVGVYFISLSALIFSLDWRLAIPVLCWLVLYSTILWRLIPRLKQVSQRQADARSTMTGRIVDSYTNIATVKLFAHTRSELAYAKQGMDEFLHSVYPQMRLVTWLYALVWGCNALLIFTVTAVAIILWTQGSVTPGGAAIAVSLCLRLNSMSQWVMWEVSSLFENIGTIQDGIGALSNSINVQDAGDAKPLKVSGGAIRFDQVSYAYDANNQVFNQLNLSIRAGEKVGLVGRSGAGKSTLVNLLLRFYDIDKGSISIDGQDITRVTQESLRRQISMVTQDTSLLHRSVRENIRYGKWDASEEEIIEAATKAKAHDFIQSLSDANGGHGYDAQVGERGVKLSGGQRQRIAIARVILKDAPILILDEATSALDSEVEVAIQQSLNDLMDNKTVVAIAHRLSTIAQMDRLLVLDKGQIVEAGSHQELLRQGGIYARLWQHQSGGFLGLD